MTTGSEQDAVSGDVESGHDAAAWRPEEGRPFNSPRNAVEISRAGAAHRNGILWRSAIARTTAAAIATVALLQLAARFTGSGAISFLALPMGGIFTVYLYSRRQPGPLTASMGARLGAVTGFFVFVILFLVSALEFYTNRDEVFKEMSNKLHEAAAMNPGPQMDTLIQQISTPAGLTTVLLLAAIMFLFMSLVLCAVGGSMGAALMNRSQR